MRHRKDELELAGFKVQAYRSDDGERFPGLHRCVFTWIAKTDRGFLVGDSSSQRLTDAQAVELDQMDTHAADPERAILDMHRQNYRRMKPLGPEDVKKWIAKRYFHRRDELFAWVDSLRA